MSDGAAPRPQVFTIPAHRSFADALAAGLMRRHGRDGLDLARGRILLPNNRAVRSVTEAFVRASGNGLLLPRLIPIGDPELDERIGGALEPADLAEPVAPAIDPLQRLLALSALVRGAGDSAAEAMRLARDLARTLDALLIEQVEPSRLAQAVAEAPELAHHWQLSVDRLTAILDLWPRHLEERGRIDLTDRRNRLLRAIERRWRSSPPEGFTVAAGITTSAPAIAALLARVARLPEGMVVLPALSLRSTMSTEEWDALGPDEQGRGEESHPQYHLKLLLERIDVARDEAKLWPTLGRAASPPGRSRGVANAMLAARFSDRWSVLEPRERRLSGVRAAEFADPAAEALGIALKFRQALETPGRTCALVTPDRMLAARVSALLARWGIDADDSAGRPLSQCAAGTLLLGIAAAVAEELAPVALLALLKHPLVGGEGEGRRRWLDDIRALDLALRGPRPTPGLHGLDRHFAERDEELRLRGCLAAWRRVRPVVEQLGGGGFTPQVSLAKFGKVLASAAGVLTGESAWRGADGRAAAELLGELQSIPEAIAIGIAAEDAVPILRQLLDERIVRPAYGGHPRVFIWGLIEARLQHADLMVLGGLNEGVWPALPTPDPWLAPSIRRKLGLPALEFRIGLSAHDFASAIGAPEVLISRARRDSRSPTVASRLWLRLQAMSGGLPHDIVIERLVAALDDPGQVRPAERPAPAPPAEQRPRRISVTAVDRLKADPFAYYAQAMLRLRPMDPVDADHSAAWKGTAVHKVLQEWMVEDDCAPEALPSRAQALLRGATIHPMLRALWSPRLLEAIDAIETLERQNREQERRPLKAEITGEAELAGVTVYGKADRIDILAGGGLAIVDYKTGAPPSPRAVQEGFALQLGLLGLIAANGGFPGVSGKPECLEYWSLARRLLDKNPIRPAKHMTAQEFLSHAHRNFATAAKAWLTGPAAFTAKLHPAFAPWGDYDQLMRLEEWYGRR